MKKQINTIILVELKQFFFLTKWKIIGGIAGLEIWKDLLINKSRRIFISGGSDAHGDFSHMTTIIGEFDNAYGIVRTYIYTEDFSEDGILNALKSGNSIMTDAAKISFYLTNKVSTL